MRRSAQGHCFLSCYKRIYGYVGILIFLIGIAGMILAPRPDILVTGDEKHLVLVSADGKVSLLRGKAGDFVRDMISEKAGSNAVAKPIEQWPGAKCTSDNYIISIAAHNRTWTILATRTAYHVPNMKMAAACRRVDIVISDRWLPQSCQPKWIKADRGLLEQTGELAI